MVYFAVVVDAVSTVSNYADVYLYTITHWGDVIYLQKQYWPNTVSLIGSGITAMIVQSFLIYRYWKLSNNFYITPILILSMLAALGGCTGALVSLLVYTAYSQRDKMALSITIWLSTSAATDIAIAVALLWQLSRINSPFRATKSLIHKLMASTIRTGTVTSVVAVITLILFLIDNESNVPTGFAFCLARVYSLTMFYNLNNRSSFKHGSADTNNANSGGISNFLNGLSVHRTATVHYGSPVRSHIADHGPLGLSDRPDDGPDSFSSGEKVSISPLGS